MNDGEGITIEKGEETNVITDLLATTPIPQANNDREGQDHQIMGIFTLFFAFPFDYLISR